MPIGPEAIADAYSRGLTDNSIEKFHLGQHNNCLAIPNFQEDQLRCVKMRNGRFDILQVGFHRDYNGEQTVIDGIGKRGTSINGGLVMDAPSFFKGAVAFLEKNGYKVTKE